MDSQLESKLRKWHKQIEVLENIEGQYFELDATEKSLEGALYLKAEGKTVDERKARAWSSEEWKAFKLSLAEKKKEYLKEKRILELVIKSYEASYLSYKLENDAIKRGRGDQP